MTAMTVAATPSKPIPARGEPTRGLQRMADRVCVLFFNSGLPTIDIEIEKGKSRQFVTAASDRVSQPAHR